MRIYLQCRYSVVRIASHRMKVTLHIRHELRYSIESFLK